MNWNKEKFIASNPAKGEIMTREFVNEKLDIDLTEEQYDQLALIDLVHLPLSPTYTILQVLKVLEIL